MPGKAWDKARAVAGDGADYAINHPGTAGHAFLDAVGQIPALGDIGGDLINGLWYAAEGNVTDAGVSLFGVVPYLGNVATGGRGLKKVKGAADAMNAAATKGAKSSRAAAKSGSKTTFDPPGKALPSEAFHSTRAEIVESIKRNGLRPGAYVTPKGDLSPFQAQIDLALPPNRGLPSVVIRVDLNKMRRDHKVIPAEFTHATRKYRMPGGGQEMRIPGKIDPKYFEVLP